LHMGQRVRGYMGMGQSQRSKFLTNGIIRGSIAYKFITYAKRGLIRAS
jgi:hypothetical protein